MAWTVCAGLLLGGCGGDDDGYGCQSGDPYRNAVSDQRAPKTTVTVRDDDGQLVADLAYSAPNGHIPARGTTASLQTLEAGTWSTAYTLALDAHNIDDDRIIACVPEGVNLDSVGRNGPDTYPLPELDPNDTYRICVTFVFRHRPIEASGCSAAFHSN
jgi:hypothetical protein